VKVNGEFARLPWTRAILECDRCPRLREHCAEVARKKRRAYRDEEYWGKPIAPFGAARPRLLIVGLAPGAHGANRTGRIFTGDRSGDWLYEALFRYGFANRPESLRGGDGLRLRETLVTCAVRCAPPGNKPLREERDACRPYLARELERLTSVRVIVALGRIAFDEIRKVRAGTWGAPRFGHGAEFASEDGRTTLLCSYHPSQQNTQTGRLTRPMFHAVFRRARKIFSA
jgi:uracil-DNA glycosylase family 4